MKAVARAQMKAAEGTPLYHVRKQPITNLIKTHKGSIMKTIKRYSLQSLAKNETDDNGKLFLTEKGFTDLSKVEIVGASVDTVRQLFHGKPNMDMVSRLEKHATDGESIVAMMDCTGMKQWHFTRMGKVARYRYKLQDNEEGIVILFGSFFAKMDQLGQHLKIELSPHFINQRNPQQIWARLHDKLYGFSSIFLEDAVPMGCAIHLACDYQDFSLPTDFISKFSTYSRTFRSYDGINSIDLSDISESIVSYGGKNQSKNYLIGKASSTQFCIYDKSHEIIKSDKVDYFHRFWGTYSQGIHNPDKTTYRIEARLHHQIIREIGVGMNKPMEAYIDIVPYLTDLWRYALSKNRLNEDDKHQHIHPFWHLLMHDVYFSPAQNLTLVRKKKQTVSPLSKNLGLALGNMITIYARQEMNVKSVMRQLRTLTFYPDIVAYYDSRGLTESDLHQYVEKSLCLRRLIGKAA